MIRFLNVSMLTLTLMICFGLYRVTHAAQERRDELASVEREIQDEKRAINVLKAEFSLLSQPSKLEAMADRHLHLQPVSAQQIAYVSDLPMRAPPAASIADIPMAGEAPTVADAGIVYDDAAPTPSRKPRSIARR